MPSLPKSPVEFRVKWKSLLLSVDVVYGVADGSDPFRVFVGYFQFEVLFELHDQLDRVQRVGAQILDEAGVGTDIRIADSKLVHNDRFHLLLDR